MTARKTKCISEARYSEVSWLLLLTCVGLRAIEKLKALLVRLALHSAQPHCREALQVLRPSFRDVHRPHHGVCEPNRTEPKLLLRSLFLSLSHSLCVSVSLSRSLCEAESQRASPLAKKLGLQMWRNVVLLLSKLRWRALPCSLSRNLYPANQPSLNLNSLAGSFADLPTSS